MTAKAPRPAPYAEGTDVPVEKSQGEIQRLLRKHGAQQLIIGADEARGLSIVGFTIESRQYRIVLKRRVPEKRWSSRPVAKKDTPEQLEREQWRALGLVLKAKLEIASRGDSTVQQEFLAHLVLPNGQTAGEWMEPQIEQAYQGGGMPPLLPSGEGR